MSRLIFVPQMPVKMRYSEWYYHQFPIQLMDYFDKTITIGNNKIYDNTDKSMFSPIDMSVKYQTEQIDQFINTELYSDDILLFMDLSFPGVFQQYLYHKRPYKAYCFCHATSINHLDYFSEFNNKYDYSKFLNELSNILLFDKVFVATNYHRNKILYHACRFFNDVTKIKEKLVVLGALPPSPMSENKHISFNEKNYDLISLSRPSYQKVNQTLENIVEKELNINIVRRECNSWNEYSSFLNNSKLLLVTSKEDTYGYQIMDAALNGCFPIAPDKLAYPEILFEDSLYNDIGQLISYIHNYLTTGPPEEIWLKNLPQIYNFYDNLALEMLE